jgi:hexosaminidase
MKNNLLFLFVSFLCIYSCQPGKRIANQEENQYNIIPQPASLKKSKGQFVLDENTTIIIDQTNNRILKVVNSFIDKVDKSTGNKLFFQKAPGGKNTITFELDQTITNEEAYTLSVTSDRIEVKAKNPVGLFYAIQTLRQLLPNDIEKNNINTNAVWAIPNVEISDSPRFIYRGMHLDVSRHFFDVKTVKEFIDQLAYHKLNYFHWHLTDDQGWRIEIKKHPKLTEIGAFRNGTLIGHYNDQPHQFDNKRYGGFYTQEDIRAVVKYASERFITVVPEIEMPGHAQATLAAYPELACKGDKFEVLQKWGVSEDVYCPNEKTFAFLEDVIDEVLDLFPGKYIHIGGDECPKTRWKESAFCKELMRKEGLKDTHELQSYFISRMEKYINKKGRKIIGWDEILEGGLAPNAAVMSWRGTEGGIEAAKAGHDVVMTPTAFCYFDYYQSDHPDEPLAIGGLISLEKIYGYEPIPEELNEEEAKHILGTQANLWTEYITTPEKLEYMTFPRLCALAEVAWSTKASRNFEDFVTRLSPHLQRLEIMGINTANHLYELNSSIQPKDGKVVVDLDVLAQDATIYYNLNNNEPTTESILYDGPLTIDSSTVFSAQAFKAETKKGRSWQQKITLHKAAGKQIQITNKPHPKYVGGGDGSIINGVLGNSERYGDAEWLGFEGMDFEAIIDLGKEEKIQTIDFRFFKGEGQWIYLPKAIHVYLSADGESYEEVAIENKIGGESKVVDFSIAINKKGGRFLRIVAENYGVIPEGSQGAGNNAWLFIDEISVN